MFLFLFSTTSSGDEFFQSPFSGDFLCFSRREVHGRGKKLSISIFRRFSLFRDLLFKTATRSVFFQSPFSGDFLCFLLSCQCSTPQIPQLSISIFRRFSLFPKRQTLKHIIATDFQSPFSGDFLCFLSNSTATIL